MIYNLISSDLIKEVTFISVLFAFILTCAAIALGKNILRTCLCHQRFQIRWQAAWCRNYLYTDFHTFLRVIYQTGCGNYHLSDFNACGNVKRLLR